MALTTGTRIGPYDIIAPLGAGGMGEVYRARDARLGRDVAIKALPAEFAQDPERLARFEREARLLASLSHANIAGILGLEEADGSRYLVLEFVEGESLAQRIARGALPVDEACDVCRQVAAGVEAAHESGVVHRDLKPGNIMLTPGGAVKVLDFGLAKGGAALASSNTGMSASPTITQGATAAGVILGTAAYMSPEQARGRAVDRRTDVWSFGCVLFECLTARQAYEGETVSDVIARILEREPEWSALPAATPPRVAELLRRCLTKDASQRLRDIGEARIALGPARSSGSLPAPGPARPAHAARPWLLPVLAAALAAVATAIAVPLVRPAHAPAPVRRFRLPVEGLTTTFFSPLALSRDGLKIAYEAQDLIWVRPLDQLDPLEVPGSKGGRTPFWSYDQQTLVFAAAKKLWVWVPGAKDCRALCDIPESGEILGGAWAPDGRIVFAVWRGGLYDLPSTGGTVNRLLPQDTTIVDYHSPSWLPDGRTLLLYIHERAEGGSVAVLTGSPPSLKRVMTETTAMLVSYSPAGYLLLGRARNELSATTWAVPFSASRLEVTGPGIPVLADASYASDASNGLMAAADLSHLPPGQLVWERPGTAAAVSVGGAVDGLNAPALSPDGRRVAYVAIHEGNPDIWVQDLERGTTLRLTSSPAFESAPAWSPDGSRIVYNSYVGVGTDRLVSIASDGSGAPDTLAKGFLPCPAPDGRQILFTVDRQGQSDLWSATWDHSAPAKPYLATDASEFAGSLSPDGRWITYTSDESGDNEIYLRRFPEGDQRAQVSVGGGTWPRWMPKGDAIYYFSRDTAWAVSVRPGPRPLLGLPHRLFPGSAEDLQLSGSAHIGFPMQVSGDGSRFMAIRNAGAPSKRSLMFIENWVNDVRKH